MTQVARYPEAGQPPAVAMSMFPSAWNGVSSSPAPGDQPVVGDHVARFHPAADQDDTGLGHVGLQTVLAGPVDPRGGDVLAGSGRSVKSRTSAAPASRAARLAPAVTAPASPRPRGGAGVWTGATRIWPAVIGLRPAMETGVPSGVSPTVACRSAKRAAARAAVSGARVPRGQR
ncbi:hypothetical protein [Streptomyces phaeolivaceus]|uniref:hypothetical protein n=1 Tax=Streptomyces phaeolivaceus TaxID=2653200 RepID=UPI00384B0725